MSPAKPKAKRKKHCEADLYPPLKSFLEGQGYAVKGEVRDCDVVAVRGDEPPLIVELKTALNLKAVLQAVQRLTMSPTVYLGVPIDCPVVKGQRRDVTRLLRMLGVGLVLIDSRARKGGATVLLDPGEYKPKKSKSRTGYLLGEFHKRVGDPNAGGMSRRRGIMTAYRQNAIRLADYLHEHGPSKASDVARALEAPDARAVFYNDVYGWFERQGKGVYALTPRGETELATWTTPPTIKHK